MKSLIILILCIFPIFHSLNILVYSPLYAASHTNFMARMADVLTEAGHNVTFFTPIIDEARKDQLGVKVTKDVVVLEQDAEMKSKQITIDNIMNIFWTMDVTSSNVHRVFETIHQQAKLSCGNVFRNHDVMEQLRSRHFDVALAEPLMICGFALFRHLGIQNMIMTSSCVNYDILIPATGEPEELSYLPSMSSQVSDKMNFAERLENYKIFQLTRKAFAHMFDDEMAVYREFGGAHLPSWRDLLADASLHFVNSVPFIDFPRPSIQKTIAIGGIALETQHNQLSSEWSTILNKRPHNMFVSFGSLARSSEMPHNFKQNLLKAFRSEPNVTFIWKYETDDVEFAEGVENVEFVKWVPQVALLDDVRLTAFLTHGGLGSTNEVAYFGKPAIMVPIFADQSRNSQMLARHGMAIVLHKSQLGNVDVVLKAFHDILHHNKYKENAEKVSKMMKNQPLKPKETVVNYVEFVGKFGPLHQMTPQSLRMSWIERYNYDVYLFIFLSYFIPLVLIFISIRWLFSYFSVTLHAKKD